jgi:prephenate dehydrogenase
VRLAIVGLGLIGGSIARAIRVRAAPNEPWSVAAWTPSGTGPSAALAAGVIDAAPASIAETLTGADLVVLAAPPIACLELLGRLADGDAMLLEPGATVTDVASTKEAIVARAAELGLPFVGGHPMAGSDRSGWSASSPDLFVERPWVVSPPTDAPAGAVERVEDLARVCGARPIRMGAADHDRAAAAVSHLPLLLSVALVEAVRGAADGAETAALAASAWRGMTRLASGDVDMAAGIAATNARNLAARARDVRAVLDRWIEQLELDGEPDPGLLRARFQAARDALFGDALADD